MKEKASRASESSEQVNDSEGATYGSDVGGAEKLMGTKRFVELEGWVSKKGKFGIEIFYLE